MAKARIGKWAIVVLVLLALVAGGLWFAGQGPFLDWVVRRAVSATEGRLAVDNARGSLYSGVQFDRLAWRDPAGPTIEVREGELSWRLGALVEKRLHVPLVKARSVQVELPPSDDQPGKPTELPESLKLPIGVQIDDVVVNTLSIVPAPADGKEATPFDMQGVRLALAYRDGRYNLQRMAMTTQWGTVEANAQLDDAEPFLISAETRVVARLEGLADPIPAQLAIGGSMDLIQARGSAQLGNAEVHIGGLMRPTDEQPFGPIRFEASGIELRRFAEAAPEARFRLNGVIEPRLAEPPAPGQPAPGQAASGQAAPGQAAPGGGAQRPAARGAAPSTRAAVRAAPAEPGGLTVTGHVDLVNEIPGRLDQAMLPVNGLSTRFDLRGDVLTLIDTALSFGDAGVIGGGGRIDLARVGSVPGAPFTGLDIDLRVSDVDVARLHDAVVPTRLGGSVKATDAGVAVDINDRKGELLAGGLSLRGVFNLQDQSLVIRNGELRARDGALRVGGSVGLDDGHAFDLKGSAERFEPQRWIKVPDESGGRFLRGRINGQWAADGRIKPKLDARVSVNLQGSRLNDQPLSGHLKAELLGPPSQAASRPPPGSFARVPAAPARADAASSGAAGAAGATGATGATGAAGPAASAAPTEPAASSQSNAGHGRSAPADLAERGKKAPAVVASPDAPPAAGNARPAEGTASAGPAAPAEPMLQRVRNVDLQLVLGGTRLAAKGALGQSGDRLSFNGSARALAELDPRLAGGLQLDGELRGTFTEPAVRGQWRGNGLRVHLPADESSTDPAASAARTIAIDATRGNLDVAGLGRERLKLQGGVDGLDAAGVKLDSINVQLDGALPEHTFRLALAGAGQRLAANGAGRFDDGARPDGQRADWSWAGRINALDVGGAMQASLQRPATVQLRPGAYAVEGLSAALAGGRLRIDNGRFEQGRVIGKGDFDDIVISRLLQAMERWKPGSVDPELIRTVDVSARGKFDVNGTSVDDLSGALGLDLVSRGIDGTSRADLTLDAGRLDGKLALRVPSLAWTRQMLGDEWRLDGELAFDGAVMGRVTAPRLIGDLKGDRLQFAQRLLGWRLGDGVLRAHFDTDRLQLDRMRFTSGDGSIELKGQLALPAADAGRLPAGAIDLGRGDFTLALDHLPVLIGPGQRVLLSGATPIRIDANVVRWTGKVRVDEGLVELRDINRPVEPGDLVVVDRRKPAAPAETPEQRGKARDKPLPVRMITDLEFDVGDRLRIVGNGIDAWLRGAIRITGELPQAPQGHGTIVVREGKYRGYGQDLAIENGRILFDGALDNPVLDITAIRRYLPVEAGVAITGNAQAPRIRLVSTPEASDAEKLSWMVLGVPLSDAGGGTVALKAAAATLFGNDDRPSGGLSELLGVDVIGISTAGRTGSGSALPSAFTSTAIPGVPGTGGMTTSSSTAQQNVVTVGKRLSSRLFISYEQGLQGVWNLLKIQYDINRRLSLRASTGTESAIDLLYFYLFD
ncbi:MAG: translocation/assembly module TamB domain-containing protein [Burkholderiaceae bacterium]